MIEVRIGHLNDTETYTIGEMNPSDIRDFVDHLKRDPVQIQDYSDGGKYGHFDGCSYMNSRYAFDHNGIFHFEIIVDGPTG